MHKGIKLFSVFGIRIYIDYTWFIVFVLVAWSLAYGYYPTKIEDAPLATYLALGIFSSLMLFACVLIHELSHSVVSNNLGIEIKSITLFIFGGVAELTREPDEPGKEFKIAIAGPIASLALAFIFKVFEYLSRTSELGAVPTAFFELIATVNIVLLVFNMFPGFPLDGGRALRAIWWAKTGSIKDATRVTSTIGRALAMVLIFLGVIQLFSGFFIQGIWAILIGTFLMQAADTGYRQLVMKLSLEGLKVRDIMTTNVIKVDARKTIDEVVNEYFFKYHFVSFPVMYGSTLKGMLSLVEVRGIEKDRWRMVTAEEAAAPINPEHVLKEEEPVEKALENMIKLNIGRAVVMEGNVLKGIVSRRDILKTIEFKSQLEA